MTIEWEFNNESDLVLHYDYSQWNKDKHANALLEHAHWKNRDVLTHTYER